MSNLDCFEGCINLPVCVEACLVYKIIKSLVVKQGLYTAKHGFYSVEFWRVTHIVDGLYIELDPPLLEFFGLVYCQLVHKQRNRLLTMFLAKLFKIVTEDDTINGLIVDLTETYAAFFCH